MNGTKRIFTGLVFAGCCVATIAQEKPTSTNILTTAPDLKAAAAAAKKTTIQPATSKRPVTAHGVLADIARTNRPFSLFNLKTPVDPKETNNAVANPNTGRQNPTPLLSIKF